MGDCPRYEAKPTRSTQPSTLRGLYASLIGSNPRRLEASKGDEFPCKIPSCLCESSSSSAHATYGSLSGRNALTVMADATTASAAPVARFLAFIAFVT